LIFKKKFSTEKSRNKTQTVDQNLTKIEQKYSSMAEENILKKLRETFPSATEDDWKRAASQEIDGKNPSETLQWNNAGSPTFEAYYHPSDRAVLTGLKNFQLSASSDPLGSPRAWINLPKINVTNSATANAVALDHLQQGAEGVLLNISQQTIADFPSLLEKIEWPYCFISFQLKEENISALANYIYTNSYEPDSLAGAFIWHTAPAHVRALSSVFSHQKKIKTLSLQISASTPTTEITEALIKGVDTLEILSNAGVDLAIGIHQIAFSLSIGTNFFLEAAKLKALRALWFQVVRAYGVANYIPSDLHLHIRSEVWLNENYQPHSNMLKATTAAMAAILGGCNSLTVEAEEESNSTMKRIARNISNVLRKESHLDKVADALAGAQALDTLTNTLAEKAWKDFQHQSKSGR